MVGALLLSLLPGLAYYKIAGVLRMAPRYVGPYFIPMPANMKQVGTDLEAMKEWLESGQIKTTVSKVFAFEELPAALEKLKGNGHDGSSSTSPFRGKFCVRIS